MMWINTFKFEFSIGKSAPVPSKTLVAIQSTVYSGMILLCLILYRYLCSRLKFELIVVIADSCCGPTTFITCRSRRLQSLHLPLATGVRRHRIVADVSAIRQHYQRQSLH